MTMTTAQLGNGVEIVSKANAVLDTLRALGQAGVPQISESIGEPVSSVYRLVANLCEAGWVEHGTQRGRYRIGSKIVTLGGLVESRLDIQRISRDVLWPLRSSTAGTWSLYVRRGLRAVCIEVVSDLVSAQFSLRVGDSLPLDIGAASLLLVAFMPASEREAALEQLLATRPSGRSTAQTRNRFRTDADQARRTGLAIDLEETSPGVATIGAPVLNRRGEIEGAITLTGVDPAHARTSAVRPPADLVSRAAADVSARLGHHEGIAHDADHAPVLG
ncbi:IclR family transcriptional regulator [Acidipropionibacterium jensenii]|uniref:IclR family transcriptional regulator n=2 Tax=Acidipropionibacterium jensenii TaxID=1749 RepID=UPI001F3A5C0C|nr:IclR family transcriptional regulator [Acidipropionibacterium jensenii]MDN5977873.1 IclR family transcriptional regulator [Acidipropionibacterium jensenii]MDN5995958.1 IclR family transcriptional regulator [Acidipropionibacterium jensenii]MDN6427362.1 IclR family transcriptional regulator [Acidipropionibacterium jensenii]MDN6441723.1 IclR family transcriptional regulator [Acidipropionibacterium jensenii]MDN6480821.1 IclR family transcriptional regulator [Acidipropionibacterium jensenii]